MISVTSISTGNQMTPAENVHELKARELKARKVAGYLITRLAESMEAADDEHWGGAAREAGVNPCSAETRKRVLEMLRGIR